MGRGGQLEVREGPEHVGQLPGPEVGGVGGDQLQQQGEAGVGGEALRPGGAGVGHPVQGCGRVDGVEVPALCNRVVSAPGGHAVILVVRQQAASAAKLAD